MLPIFNDLRDITVWSTAVRMLLAVVCGGAIGMERTYKRRAAGFRTHILICLGAAMTTLTSQYLYLNLGYYTDMARLGAQVVAGVGFIGAGCIIVTRRNRVKGLTTAAGLWGAAIIGLALGGGFYEGGLAATILLLLAELYFSKLEYWMLRNAPEINLYMEYTSRNCLENVLKYFREHGMKLVDIEITRHAEGEKSASCSILTLRLNKRTGKQEVAQMIELLHDIKGVSIVEEL